MNSAKYNEIIERLKELVDFFQRSNFSYNQRDLFLGTGEILRVRYPKGRIAHLLGVNLDYLSKSNQFKKEMNTYERLIYFLDNAHIFRNLEKEGKLCFESMFSKNIEGKLDSFKDNLFIRNTDLVAVVKYDSERAYQGDGIMSGSEYYIIRQRNSSYYVLGLAKVQEEPTKYLPVTSRKYDDKEEFEKFMRKISYKQELTFIHNMNTRNPKNEFECKVCLNQTDRIKQMKRLLALSKRYNASVEVGFEYLYLLEKTNTRNQCNSVNIEVLKLLIQSIKNKHVLTIDEKGIDDSLILEEVSNLVSQCNDMICSGVPSSEMAVSSYSELVAENQSLKEKYCQLRENLTRIQKENQQLMLQNTQLQAQNNLYGEQLAIYNEAYKRVLSLTQSPKEDEQS